MTTSSDWLVRICNFPCPAGREIDVDVRARYRSLCDLWVEHISPLVRDFDADFEDFVEQAVRLEAALSAFGPDHIWMTLDDITARNLGSGEMRDVSELEHLPKWGAQSTPTALRHLVPEADPASRYFALDTFRRHAGREVHLCASDQVTGIATDMAARGVKRIFVKVAETKYGVYDIALPDPSPHAVEHEIAMSDLGWALVHLDGKPDAFIVQEHIPMIYEYRLFVVGHKVITGAVCIESFTPLDNQHTFDYRVERVRGSLDIARSSGSIHRFIHFGDTVAAEFADESPEMRDYTLDVALGSNHEPLIIELNGILNSGLYATQTSLVTAAMRDTHLARSLG